MDKSDAIEEIDEFRIKLASTGTHSKGPSFLNAKHCLLIFVRSFVIAALIFLVSAIILPPTYDGVDDVHMTMIASGVGLCQRPDAHIVFGHFLWGQALAWLYSSNGNVPWYGLSLCLANIFSLALVLSVFSWERASAARRALVLVLYVFSLLSLWANLQYTSTAIFAAAAASLAVLSTLEVGTLSKSGKAVALALAALGLVAASLLRLNSATIMTALFAGLICCRFLVVNLSFKYGLAANVKRLAGSKLGAGLLIVASMFCLIYGLTAVNSAFYARDPRWIEFENTRPTFVKIADYQRVTYSEKSKPLLDAFNWTKGDLELCQNYYYPIDPTLFSFANAKALVSQSQGVRSDLSPNAVLNDLRKNILSPFVLPGLLLALILLPLTNTSIVSRRRQIAYIAVLVGMLVYLLVCMKLVMRVTIPLSAWALLLAIYYCDESKVASVRSVIASYLSAIPFASRIPREPLYANGKKFCLIALAFLLVVAVGVIGINANRCAALASARQKFKTSLVAAHQRIKGTLYIAPSFIPFQVISPFENPREYFGDMAVLVPYFAPAPLRDIEARVIKDTQLPLLDDGVYVFSSKFMNSRLTDYYRDHHRLRVTFDPCYIDQKARVKAFKARVDNAGSSGPASAANQIN